MCYVVLPPELSKKAEEIDAYRVHGRIPDDAPAWVKEADLEIRKYYYHASHGPNGEQLM